MCCQGYRNFGPDFDYHFLFNAVVTQASLHEIIFGPRVQYIYHSTCTPKYSRASMSTISVTCQSHRHRDSSPPTLVTNTSAGMGAKKKPVKYVAVDRLLQKAHPGVEDRGVVPIYEALKHSHQMIQSRHFFILTEHMPIIFTFQQKKDKISSRHLTNWITSSYSRRKYAIYSDRITSWPTRFHAPRPTPHK